MLWRVIVTLLLGILLAGNWFLFCIFVSELPVLSDVSLALAFKPWWRHWQVAVFLLCVPIAIATVYSVLERLLGTENVERTQS